MPVHHVVDGIAATILDKHGIMKSPVAFAPVVVLALAGTNLSLRLHPREVKLYQMKLVFFIRELAPLGGFFALIDVREHPRLDEEPPEFLEQRVDGVDAEAGYLRRLGCGTVPGKVPEHLLEPPLADFGGMI